jgi:hypothetical protein
VRRVRPSPSRIAIDACACSRLLVARVARSARVHHHDLRYGAIVSAGKRHVDSPRRIRNVRGVKTGTGASCRSVRSRSPEISASACAATANETR